jgi:hypothetical protein
MYRKAIIRFIRLLRPSDLDLNSLLQCLPLLLLPSHRLCAHDSTSPVPSMLLVLLGIALIDRAHQFAQLTLILSLDLRKRQHRRRLLVHYGPEPSLPLDDRVWDAHLPTQGREVNDQLDGVDVVGDENESRLLVLDQPDDVVQAVFDSEGFLGYILLLLALGDGGRFSVEALFLGRLSFRTVFVQELEGLGGGVAVEGVLELGDRGGNLKAEVEDLLLALQADVFWPPDHAGEVAGGLDILADAVVAGAFLDERVLMEGISMSTAR